MAVLSFNYTRLNAERMQGAQGKVNINNSVSVNEVERQEISFDDNDAVKITFKYQSEYKPEVAKIEIEGQLVYVDEEHSVDELLEEWDEDSTLPEDTMRNVINSVLNKCNVEAIMLSRDLNIPSPIPLPEVEADADAEE